MDLFCSACSQLQPRLKRSDFTSPPFEPEGRYHSEAHAGTFKQLRSTRASCALCNLIYYALSQCDKDALAEAKDDERWSLMWSQSSNDYIPDETIEDTQDLYGSALFPCFGTDGRCGDYGIQLIDEYGSKGFLRGRLVSDQIDIKLVTDWICRCQDLHGENCTSRSLDTRSISATPITDLTVIDVEDLRLCSLPTGVSYSALSYVWGNSNRPVSLISNQSAFHAPRGLAIKLSQTVQDAIDVTRALGIRFTWIDSLCIVQDDPAPKQILIDNMDAIYSSSTVTLVAASGSGADAGLSGWSNRAARTQRTVTLGSNFRLGVLPYYQRELLECDHAQRAWTYQETTLSPRCLVFLNGFVYFNCNAAVWSEHTASHFPGIIPEATANTLGKTEVEGSALRKYAQHVTAYTWRKLTFPGDGLNAFKGIVQATARTLGGRDMIYGMPGSCFDWVLLWTHRGELRRRPGFPSWAWVGWEGEILVPQPLDGGYEEMWLRKGTWVDWYVVGEDGRCRAVWDSEQERAPSAYSEKGRGFVSENGSEELGGQGDGRVDEKYGAVRDEGEDADDQDDGDEEDPCPSYGYSTPDNPFGRSLHPELARLLPKLGHSGAIQRFERCVSKENGLLCFSAPTITLSTRSWTKSETSATRPLTASLHDINDRICGFLSITNYGTWPEPRGNTVKLLLISLTSYADLSSHHYSKHARTVYETYGTESTLKEYLDGQIPHDVNFFDFLNVLAVRKVQRMAQIATAGKQRDLVVHERVGVGFVHRTTLRDSDVCWESFTLA